MPRKTAPSPAPSTPVEDPLADLRDDADRYPEQEAAGAPGGDEGEQGSTEGPDALLTVLLARLEAAMGIMGDPTDDQRAMALALATEMAEELAPLVAPIQDLTWEAAVEVWHEDTVALGFLHKGGRCGCRYISQTILGA